MREALQFCLAVALEDSGKATLVNTAQIEGRTHYSYQTVAGNVFTMIRPDIDAEIEKMMQAELVGMVEEG